MTEQPKNPKRRRPYAGYWRRRECAAITARCVTYGRGMLTGVWTWRGYTASVEQVRALRRDVSRLREQIVDAGRERWPIGT